jgi:hypothetical protein
VTKFPCFSALPGVEFSFPPNNIFTLLEEAMIKGRILLAGVLAGIVSFIWGAASHTLLNLGESAMKEIPNESAVLPVMNQSIREPGFYFYPGGMMSIQKLPKEQQEAATRQWEETYRTMPHGILILTPPNGTLLNFPKLLLTQLGIDVIGGVIAAVLLSLAAASLPSLVGRVLFVASLGVFASLAIDAPYCNWYGFPGRYLISSFIDSTVGWALAGLVLALLIKPRPAA